MPPRETAAESMEIEMKPVEPGRPTTLRLYGVEHSPESFSVRVFVNDPDADARTPIRENDHFASSIYMYGHGDAAYNAAQFDPERTATRHRPATKPLERFDTLIDLTQAVQRTASRGESLRLTFVVVGPSGEPLSASLLRVSELSVEQR